MFYESRGWVREAHCEIQAVLGEDIATENVMGVCWKRF